MLINKFENVTAYWIYQPVVVPLPEELSYLIKEEFCYLCGGVDFKDQFLYCCLCQESYHPYCISPFVYLNQEKIKKQKN